MQPVYGEDFGVTKEMLNSSETGYDENKLIVTLLPAFGFHADDNPVVVYYKLK